MKLSMALLAGLPQRELNAILDTGRIAKADQRAIMALRAGDPTGKTGYQNLNNAIRKQFDDRDRSLSLLKQGIYEYARHRLEEAHMPTADNLLDERVDKAHDTQKMLRKAVRDYQELHPGCNRADALDAVLFSPEVSKMVVLEKRMDDLAKAKNTLPQQLTRDIDFGVRPVQGRTGYDSSVDGRRPGTAHASGGPQSGDEDEPEIGDHNQLLADIQSGKIPYSDPRVSALVRHERRQRFAKD